MRRTDLSLDEEIAEVEGRLAQHRMQLRALAAEARSRVSLKNAVPVALVAALAVGFTASRFVRRPAPAPAVMRSASRTSRTTRIAGALASALLPRLIRPLQHAIEQWLAERMRRPNYRS
ncbi:MAG TPA: hypothetical protein VLI21_01385 [Casimicrobiaceae bacterium]|nr:hypothetical protein [Casimicrobiaceae bacterium]